MQHQNRVRGKWMTSVLAAPANQARELTQKPRTEMVMDWPDAVCHTVDECPAVVIAAAVLLLLHDARQTHLHRHDAPLRKNRPHNSNGGILAVSIKKYLWQHHHDDFSSSDLL